MHTSRTERPTDTPLSTPGSKINERTISGAFELSWRDSRRGMLRVSLLYLLVYMSLCTWVYGYWLEKWGALRAMYFGVVTFTT
jgi:hypothetical protein